MITAEIALLVKADDIEDLLTKVALIAIDVEDNIPEVSGLAITIPSGVSE